MKRVLILSYHALPLDVISSYRANAYLNHLHKYGYRPTLITHDWDNPDSNEIKEEDFDFGTVIRIPIGYHMTPSWKMGIEKTPFLNKIGIFLRWLQGHLDNSPEMIGNYRSYKMFCNQHLNEVSYHLILGIFSPHHHLRLCYELHMKTGVPYMLDFRDLWDNRIIHLNYTPNFTQKIQDHITRYFWKRWLSKAISFSVTSKQWADKINEFSTVTGYVILNGFDGEKGQNQNKSQGQTSENSSEFIVVYAGSLYQNQKLDIFLEGCRQFVHEFSPSAFKVKFIGADREGSDQHDYSGYLNRPKEKIRSFLTSIHCDVTKRVPKSEMLKLMEQAQIALFPSLPDSPGTYLGKIYDYLWSERNILVVPEDHLVGDIVRETQTGVVCNTAVEVANYLKESYDNWMSDGYLKYEGNEELIYKYSRQEQVKKLASIMDNYLVPE
ncbi:hypothetical protein [Marinoscillum sp.]|uniref:hypothetical protein n=1 Tax=Marinoscillum sp. TaxID=2024838 RepID=UPI003BA8962B